jgi:hypothetical protein
VDRLGHTAEPIVAQLAEFRGKPSDLPSETMDERIRELGNRITTCSAGESCPDIKRGVVTNDVADGIPPRGLFIRPSSARLEEVDVIILGLNPGRADDNEKRLLRDAANRIPDQLFRVVHAETICQMHRWRYWQHMDDLLRHLGLPTQSTVVLAAELVFCECVRPSIRKGKLWKPRVGARAIRFCTTRYLHSLLEQVPATAVILCVGARARDWVRHSRWNDKFRWAWVKHITGSWGTFSRMFGPDGKVKPQVTRAWQDAMNGSRKGHSLSAAADV